jgi:hypothetical protein
MWKVLEILENLSGQAWLPEAGRSFHNYIRAFCGSCEKRPELRTLAKLLELGGVFDNFMVLR